MHASLRRWGIWIFMLLIAPLLLGALGLHPNRIESGAKVEAPDLEFDRLLERSYYSDIDDYINETIAVRGLGLSARASLDYDLFGDAWLPLLAGADDGFLFSRLNLALPCPDVAAIEPPPVSESLAASGGVHVMLNMSKVFFYGDLLEAHDKPPPCIDEEREAVRQRFSELANLIDADQALLDGAGEGDKPVFFPADSHWSAEGRMIVAESVIEKLQPGLWDPDAVVDGEIRELQVYFRFLGRNDGTTIAPVVRRTGLELTTLERTTNSNDLLLTSRTQASGLDVIPGRTLLIGDSQISFLMPALEQYFEDLEFFYWDHLATAAALPDAVAIDRLIVQSVETAAASRFRNPQLFKVIAQIEQNTRSS